MNNRPKLDPERRAALVRRREQLRHERQLEEQLYGLHELRDGLTAAAEPFEILYWGTAPEWTPEWVPAGYSRIAWELHRPANQFWFDGDLPAGAEAFRRALLLCAQPSEILLLVFEGRMASFRMARSVAERNSRLILDGGISSLSPLWVTSPPSQWLIEVSSEAVRVGTPVAGDAPA
jgi:hypothetical protein